MRRQVSWQPLGRGIFPHLLVNFRVPRWCYYWPRGITQTQTISFSELNFILLFFRPVSSSSYRRFINYFFRFTHATIWRALWSQCRWNLFLGISIGGYVYEFILVLLIFLCSDGASRCRGGTRCQNCRFLSLHSNTCRIVFLLGSVQSEWPVYFCTWLKRSSPSGSRPSSNRINFQLTVWKSPPVVTTGIRVYSIARFPGDFY